MRKLNKNNVRQLTFCGIIDACKMLIATCKGEGGGETPKRWWNANVFCFSFEFEWHVDWEQGDSRSFFYLLCDLNWSSAMMQIMAWLRRDEITWGPVLTIGHPNALRLCNAIEKSWPTRQGAIAYVNELYRPPDGVLLYLFSEKEREQKKREWRMLCVNRVFDEDASRVAFFKQREHWKTIGLVKQL